MPVYIKIIVIVSLLVILALIITISLAVSIKKHKLKKMYTQIENFFSAYVQSNPNASVEKSTEAEYDYKLKTAKSNYYFKVIPNFGGEEITVNNSVKWQLRRSFNDETMRFVPDVEGFMRYEIHEDEVIEKNKNENSENLSFEDLGLDLNNINNESSKKKKNVKIYIIYPNARSLLMYINECEMKFINPNTDVYGTNLITFADLVGNRDSLIK